MAEQDYTQPTPEIKTSSSLLSRIKNIFNLEKIKNLNKQQLVIYGLVALVILTIIGFVIFKTTQETATPDDPLSKYLLPPKQTVTKVGEETIYSDDLNYIIKKTFPGTDLSAETKETIQQKATEQAKVESVVLQGGLKDGLITRQDLGSSVYNSNSKDQEKRQQLALKVVQTVLDNTPSVDFEMITVWYYNTFPPKIPPEQAKSITSSFMRTLRKDLADKRITMAQAGQRIRERTALAEIDASYKGNSYFKFDDYRLDRNLALSRLNIDEFLRESPVGTLSEIIDTGPEELKEGSEAYFALVLINNKKTGGDNYPDWLANHKETIK